MLARSFTVRKEKNEKLLMPTRVEGTIGRPSGAGPYKP